MTRWVPTKREEKYGVGEDAPAPLPPVAHGAPPGRGLPVPGRLRAALRGRDGARCSPLPSGSCLPRPAPPGSQELGVVCERCAPLREVARLATRAPKPRVVASSLCAPWGAQPVPCVPALRGLRECDVHTDEGIPCALGSIS